MGLSYKKSMGLSLRLDICHSRSETDQNATHEAGRALLYAHSSREAYWPVELEQAWTLDVKTPSKASSAVQPLHTISHVVQCLALRRGKGMSGSRQDASVTV